MKPVIPLNADVGEGMSSDVQIMPYLTSCNIACGGHAGNSKSIDVTLQLAKQHKVKVGAHPSYPDKANFGRQVLQMSKPDFVKSMRSQIALFIERATNMELPINHIKPHGALYNQLAKDPVTASLFLEAIDSFNLPFKIYTLPGSMLMQVGGSSFSWVAEAFLDRQYQQDGSLTPRTQKGALITNKEAFFAQAKNLYYSGKAKTSEGEYIKIAAQTFCIHGDTPNITSLLEYTIEHLKEQNNDSA